MILNFNPISLPIDGVAGNQLGTTSLLLLQLDWIEIHYHHNYILWDFNFSIKLNKVLFQIEFIMLQVCFLKIFLGMHITSHSFIAQCKFSVWMHLIVWVYSFEGIEPVSESSECSDWRNAFSMIQTWHSAQNNI